MTTGPATATASTDRRHRWEARTSRPLMVGALLFLVVYAVPILVPEGHPALVLTCQVAEWVLWFVFAVDFGARMMLAHDRLAFLREAWLDAVLLLVPMLRPLRALRAVLALNVLGRRGSHFARGKVVASVGLAVALVAFVAALAVLESERTQPEAHITTFGDAIWWAAATVTTVGYGDMTPVTGEGRLVALVLMVTGIGLLGVVTAAMASWFVEKVGQVQEATTRTENEVSELVEEVRTLREEVRLLAAAAADAARVSGRGSTG